MHLQGVVEWWVVDVGSSERFEIELEPLAPKRSRFRHRSEAAGAVATPTPPSSEAFTPPSGGGVVFTPSAPPEQPDPSGERNRLVVTALAVGAVALFLGWSLGRAGGGDGDESAQTGGTTATTVDDPEATTASTTETATTVATGDTLPEASLPTTTRPRPTTTTTLPPEWEESQVQIDGRLDGQADRIVAVGDGGRLIELDVATGSLRSLDFRRTSQASTPLPPIAGDDWVVVSFDDGRPPQLYRDGATEPETINATDAWSMLWDVRSGTFWERGWNDQTGQPNRELTERSLTGEPTGRTLDVRGLWATQVDPAGGVIVGDGSVGAYRVTLEGSERVADGYVLAMGLNHLLVYACAENFDSCGVSLLDRATGRSTPVRLDDDLVITLSTTGGWFGTPTTPKINVDGTGIFVVLPGSNGGPTWSVLDTATGELTSLPGNPSAFEQSFTYPSAAWSADGRFLYLRDDGAVVAFDRTTREMFPVVLGDGPIDVRSITLRPA